MVRKALAKKKGTFNTTHARLKPSAIYSLGTGNKTSFERSFINFETHGSVAVEAALGAEG